MEDQKVSQANENENQKGEIDYKDLEPIPGPRGGLRHATCGGV